MPATEEVELCSEAVDELAELARQTELLNMEAIELGRSMEVIAAALRIDASRIQFSGDSIMLDGRRKSSQLTLVLVDLARMRKVVFNLSVLDAQRKRLLLSPRPSTGCEARCKSS